MQGNSAGPAHRHEMGGPSQGAPQAPSPQFFAFLRDRVGTGEIKGDRGRWVAPVALYTGLAGINESAWTITTETVIALRLHGASVEDHNRSIKRISGPGRDFALQPKGSSTRFLANGPIEFGQVFLPDSLLDRAAETENLAALSGRLRDDLSLVLEKTLQTLVAAYIRRAFDRLIPATCLEMEGRALLLVDCLLRLHQTPRADAASARGGLSPRNLRRVRDFIVEHLAKDICLNDLAELTNLTSKHFAHAFKQSTGLPPHQYLIAQRIEVSKHRLIEERTNLAQIALECGFTDQSQFTATFRKAVGVTPGTWRRDHTK